MVEEYFQAARHSFKQGDPRQGVETLTDAVRATLGHIAATRNWSHSTQDDLYGIAAALGSNSDWPATMEEFQRALDNCTPGRETTWAQPSAPAWDDRTC